MDEVIVVSGQARTGTSMMMQILKAGGLELIYDDKIKPPNEDNPKGYYEYGHLGAWLSTSSMKVIDWKKCQGKAIKITWPWILYLPIDYPYRIVHMQRDPLAVLASRRKLSRWAIKGDITEEEQAQFIEDYNLTIWATFHSILFRARTKCLPVQYETVIEHPDWVCNQIAKELLPECKLNVKKMIKAVDPELYHNKGFDKPAFWTKMFERREDVKHSKADQLR